MHGQATCTAAGTCTYTPDADYNGNDSFAYVVVDGLGRQATGIVEVTVESVDDPPVAAADRVRVAEAGVVVVEALANDSPGPPDESEQPLELASITAEASYGAAYVEPSAGGGRIRYVAPQAYSGPDWVDYRVCQAAGVGAEPRCDEGTLTVAVARVVASVETEPVPSAGDAADDAAIWVDPSDPTRSVVIGTDKASFADAGGLAVYGLDGEELQYLPGGKPNNVDVRVGFPLGGERVPLVVASDRAASQWGLATYRLDPVGRTLVRLATIPLPFEPYGLCLYRGEGGATYAFVTRNDGEGYVEQWELFEKAESEIGGRMVRAFTVGSLSEGCVADDERGHLYVSEEDVAIWKYGAEPAAGTERAAVDVVRDSGPLTADVEGLALAKQPDGTGHLIAAIQGNGSYAVYRRDAGNDFVRSFTVREGATDGTSAIDGIDVTTAYLGPAFAAGLLVSHDGSNTDGAAPANQNLKLVPLDLVLGTGDEEVSARPTSCSRPYAATSPWNVAVPAAPVLDAESDVHVSALGGRLTSDASQYTYPVYEVTSETPRMLVTLSSNGWFSNVTSETTITSEQGVTVELPLPPDAAAAAGTDAQIVLLDRATGDEWGAFRLRRDEITGAWHASNAYHYNTSWSGVPPRGSRSTDRFWSRGAGVPYLAGLVRPCEIARGRIEHALAFAYDFPTDQFVFPATKSDGKAWDGVEDDLDSHPGDVPEGTRLQLDPAITVDEMKGWGCTGPCLTIARALQDYGMYVIDNAGRPKVMLEFDGTAGWNGLVSEKTASPIPLERFRVLASPTP